MKTFQEFLNESATDRITKAIERELQKDGIQFKRESKLHSVKFKLPNGYAIVFDGNVYDLKKGDKVLDTWDRKFGISKVVDAYHKHTS